MKYQVKPIFFSSEELSRVIDCPPGVPHEYHQIRLFLLSYTQSSDTFNTYRREVERFVQWVWFIKKSNAALMTRHDIIEYIAFFRSPPHSWISPQHFPRRMIDSQGGGVHPDWRPFVVPRGRDRVVSPNGIKSMLACLSTLYTFLLHEGLVDRNPVQMIKQKKQYIQSDQSQRIKRRLSPIQWRFVIEVAINRAESEPSFERSLYVLSLFYLLGVRISEIAHHTECAKPMSLFYKDHGGRWWFEAHGKGNKRRDVAVPDAMIQALKRFRVSMGATPLPSVNDFSPLVPKIKGSGGLGARQIRALVAESFDQALLAMMQSGLKDDADALRQATVHWLRHTSISDDVTHRPSEHVRDDVGHADIATTSLYIDVIDEKRHDSAREKPLVPDD